MEYVELGNTGITVSRLCFGSLTMGPLQKNMAPKDGAALLEQAFSRGVNFIDTAEIYGTYPHIKEALRIKADAVVCTKSYAYDTQTAEQSFQRAVEGMGREYIDIFLLHEQESLHTIRGHYEAVEYYLKRKAEGYIGAVGLSTHYVACMHAAGRYPELEVLFPLINRSGVGIADGSAQEMLCEIDALHAMGRGIMAMKPLGGGHLIPKRQEAFAYILGQAGIDSIAVGMQSKAEVDFNCDVFSGLCPGEAAEREIGMQPRALLVHDWCEGCGACASACKNGALRVEGGKAKADMSRCALCGYCAGVCPQFCIKVI